MSQIEELRRIIVGGNSEQLDELRDRLENVEKRTNDVAEVLSPAINRGLENDPSLVKSFAKPVSLSLKQAIRNEPQEYAEILYPVMAPSIRRAISQAISSMMITINKTLESATSVQGLRLRYQSWRTGIPYGELALLQSIIFKVEHLYLIDRDTGMLVEEVAAANSQSLDSDAVSAMFSAIQNFVQDSFSQDDTARLEDFKVGAYHVWIAHGTKLMLACVISGDAPESLKSQLYDTLDKIRTDYATEIAEFDGDSSSFFGVKDKIAPMLQMQLKDDSGLDADGKKMFIPAFFGLLALGFVGYTLVERQTKLSTVEHYLLKAPGIAVTGVHWDGGKIIVDGLKDPDAEVPFSVLQQHGIEKDLVQLDTIPFRSLEVDMELQRFENEMDLVEGVYLSVRDAQIYLYGEAPIEWLLTNGVRVRQLAADRRLNISELSASLESVSVLLRSHFSMEGLSRIQMRSIATDFSTKFQIGGQVVANDLVLLQTMFADNYWVDVTAKAIAHDSGGQNGTNSEDTNLK